MSKEISVLVSNLRRACVPADYTYVPTYVKIKVALYINERVG